MSKNTANKWCFVPGCTNTSKNSPNKIFISVPKNVKRKKKWFAVARRDLKDVSIKTSFYCCEDHFNLEQDMENYMEYTLSKVSARMKSEIVPHIFLCQADKKESVPRTTSEKRARKRKISEILNDRVVPVPEIIMAIDNMQPSTSHQPETAEVTEIREVSEPSKHDFCCQAGPLSYSSKGTQT